MNIVKYMTVIKIILIPIKKILYRLIYIVNIILYQVDLSLFNMTTEKKANISTFECHSQPLYLIN